MNPVAEQAFSSYEFSTGVIAECDPNFPCVLSAWDRKQLVLYDGATHFGYVSSGTVQLFHGQSSLSFPVYEGMAFCAPGLTVVKPLDMKSRGIVISRRDFFGTFGIYGPLEWKGRLKYIDGCTDSLIVPPIRYGDPCLNLLYFPPGIDQTRHTHPSDRIGIILSGHGRCHRWDRDKPESVTDLDAEMIFRIHAEGAHKFSTPYGSDMRVLAFHPDSDFGPTDLEHPMINRTMVNGVSASLLSDIQTR